VSPWAEDNDAEDDGFDDYGGQELDALDLNDEDMADLEEEGVELGLDPLWTDGCPDDICVNSGWCHHRYKADPR
jgi:hypothetical protein